MSHWLQKIEDEAVHPESPYDPTEAGQFQEEPSSLGKDLRGCLGDILAACLTFTLKAIGIVVAGAVIGAAGTGFYLTFHEWGMERRAEEAHARR